MVSARLIAEGDEYTEIVLKSVVQDSNDIDDNVGFTFSFVRFRFSFFLFQGGLIRGSLNL